ncbi:MAG: alpha/beta hydrolase [Candidatus Thiodiazotropha sp.]
MNEELKFIDSAGEQLFVIEHQPDNPQPTKAYVFLHPFAEEKLWSHRVYVTTARAFCAQGCLVMRFDFRGHGDSGGEFLNSSLERHNQDIDAVISHVKQRYPEIQSLGLFGLRLGGTLASQAAARRGDVDELVLWDPVLSGDRYMQEILRSNLAAQMAVKGKVEVTRDDLIAQMKAGKPINVEGYYLTHDYFQELSTLNLQATEFPEGLKCCLVQIVKNPKQPFNKQYEQFFERFAEGSQLQKAQEEPFWKEIKTFYDRADNLLDQTLNWLD